MMQGKGFAFLLTLAFLFLQSSRLCAIQPDGLQFYFEIQDANCEGYSVGDTVQIVLRAVQLEKTCVPGLYKSRLYGKGVKICRQGPWEETMPGTWQKSFQLIIIGNRKNLWQITAFRKTDKGNIAETFTLKPIGK